jgi:hypothetical protein
VTAPAPELRVFVAHRKDDALDLGALKAEIQQALDAEAKGRRTVKVTLGREDYLARSSSLGSWAAWIRDVATGLDYVTREPRFHAYVVPDERIGKATAEIIGAALNLRKPVLRWLGDGAFRPISLVQKVAPRDFKSGWQIS